MPCNPGDQCTTQNMMFTAQRSSFQLADNVGNLLGPLNFSVPRLSKLLGLRLRERRQRQPLTVNMAEAADAPQHRFYCHCCKRGTEPKFPDLVCPTCESDFIEEVSEDSSFLQDSTASVTNEESNLLFPDIWQLLFMERSALLSNPPSFESRPGDNQQVSADQSPPSPVSPVVTELHEQETLLNPERDESSRPEQLPAVYG
ncbi:hypothetical protein AMECASPLE_031884, partial [Ameca splendens]